VLKLSKALAVVVAILPIPFALIQNKLIVDMVGAAFGTIFAAFIGPVTIGLFWRKGSSKGAVASMISGTLTGILWYTLVYKSTWIYPTVPAVAIALASYIIPSMFKKQ
jgi:Na+/pantothenate symporter